MERGRQQLVRFLPMKLAAVAWLTPTTNIYDSDANTTGIG